MKYNDSFYYRKGKNAYDVKMTEFDLHKDEDSYYLSAKFIVEDEYSIRELDVPKIRLNIDLDRVYIDTESDPYCFKNMAWINLGFGRLPLDFTDFNGQRVLYTEKILEEKYTEMTMDEIEKKLGYKVKIVNK